MPKKKPDKRPKIKKVTLENLDPTQGIARMVLGLGVPEGYEFVRMDREETKAIIIYRRVD